MAISTELRWRDSDSDYTTRKIFLATGTDQAEAATGEAALRAITNGADGGHAFSPVDTTNSSIAPPAVGVGAQRSLQWKARCVDIVTGGNYTLNLPTAKFVGVTYTKVVNGVTVVDLTSTEGLAIQEWVDEFVINPATGNKVTLSDIVLNQD